MGDADIGVRIVFRCAGVVLQTKSALIQSKRLYPTEARPTAEDHPLDYMVGFGRLLPVEQEYKSAVKARTFSFKDTSRYRALEFQGEQYEATLGYEGKTKVPVHYLLYNPVQLPHTVTYPVDAGQNQVHGVTRRIGARVISALSLDEKLKKKSHLKDDNPAFNQLWKRTSSDRHHHGR